jgi:hypothetical protein
MLQKAPADLGPNAKTLIARTKVAFEEATTAFAQSVGGEDRADDEDDSDWGPAIATALIQNRSRSS